METTGGPMTTRLPLPPSAQTGTLARRALRQLLETTAIDEDTRETAVLLANELVTNAVEHGRGTAYLDAAVQTRAIRLEVTDSSTVIPRPNTEVSDLAERGRGLLLIEALASRWGVQPRSDGKTVWCELDIA
ncbi:ATP-binding protein [Nocardioides sp. URHA0020]|uniref:ATP-binding protein n=1 Tax=Nocardioides sp. URHA0020 TaxID=1380392 RepID=UPI0004910D2E|nr:ATP-binding protein [Nocardioides sp. URHA0020]